MSSTSQPEPHAAAPAPSPSGGDGSASAALRGISSRSVWWPLLLSLSVLGVIGYLTFEPDTFARLLRNLNPWWLVAAFGTVVLRVWCGAWRLSYVSDGRLDFMGGLRGQIAWDFFSNVTPSTIGGGPIAAAFMARDRNLPLGETTAILLFSMLLDQTWFALSILLLLACGFFVDVIPASLGVVGAWSFTVYFLVLMAWVLAFGYITLFRPHHMEYLVDRIFRLRLLRRFRDRAMGVMTELRDRAHILRTKRAGFYIKGFLLTLGTWLGRYLLVVFIIWSVYPELNGALAFLRTIAFNLGSLIMPTPGGAGGLEGLYAVFLGPPLMPEALVAPTLLVWRVLGYYIFIAIGAFITMHQMQKSIRRKRREAAEAQQAAGNGQADDPFVLEETESVK